jgi:acylphosphatase
MKISRRIVVHGMVQGVGYRYFCRREAVLMGITGYVKNLFSGDVEVVAQGEKEILDQFVKVLKTGPHLSEVKDILVTELSFEDKFKSFTIEF